jgi:glycosyltransferase involved in cell wall biosynthesis
MRFSFLVRYDPSAANTGVEVSVGRISSQLTGMGHSCIVLCGGVDPRQQRGSEQAAKRELRNVEICRVRDSTIPFIGSYQFNMNLERTLAEALTSETVDVLYCNGAGPARAYSRVRSLNKSAVFVYHVSDCMASELEEIRRHRFVDPYFLARMELLIRYERAGLLSSDVIIATSESTKQGITKKYGVDANKVWTVGRGIPRDYSVGFEISDPEPPCFLVIGARPGYRRDIRSFLDALRVLRDLRGINVQSVILRDDDMSHRLFAEKHQLEVTFLNDVSDATLKNLYAKCTALVMPSLREGFCSPVVEAGAFAKPTIATAVGSLPELISHEVNGLLLKDLEPLTIANAMEIIIKDPGLRHFLGQNAKRNSEAYAIENIATKLLQAIQN